MECLAQQRPVGIRDDADWRGRADGSWRLDCDCRSSRYWRAYPTTDAHCDSDGPRRLRSGPCCGGGVDTQGVAVDLPYVGQTVAIWIVGRDSQRHIGAGFGRFRHDEVINHGRGVLRALIVAGTGGDQHGERDQASGEFATAHNQYDRPDPSVAGAARSGATVSDA